MRDEREEKKKRWDDNVSLNGYQFSRFIGKMFCYEYFCFFFCFNEKDFINFINALIFENCQWTLEISNEAIFFCIEKTVENSNWNEQRIFIHFI